MVNADARLMVNADAMKIHLASFPVKIAESGMKDTALDMAPAEVMELIASLAEEPIDGAFVHVGGLPASSSR